MTVSLPDGCDGSTALYAPALALEAVAGVPRWATVRSERPIVHARQ